MRQVAYVIFVDSTSVSETFATDQQLRFRVSRILLKSLAEHGPLVTYLSQSVRKPDRDCKACLVLVYLDPTPSDFSTAQLARRTLQNVLFDKLPKNNPCVHIAPAALQPFHSEGPITQ